ncbi:hypothetical protein [Elstera litoralis]|uniref:hypothetical protein n=1 Tax=Elstera litoralis TaxID=552518 RepID=UPI00069803E6|nr:hypothetical protein [Elstera litoralis]
MLVSCAQWLDSGVLVAPGEPERGLPFQFRRLGQEDRAAIIAFRERVFAELPDPDMYVPEVPEFVDWHLEGERGFTFGLFIDSHLAAVTVLGLPKPGMPNFATDLPVPPANLDEVAHIASSMVDGRFRGFGLQRRLFNYRTLMAIGAGRPILTARVALTNPTSWRNMLGCGMLVGQLLVMHGDKLRFLFVRDLRQAPLKLAEAERLVLLRDVEGHRAALAEGLMGFKQVTQDGASFLAYGAPTA